MISLLPWKIVCSILILILPAVIHGNQPFFINNMCLSKPSGNFTQNSFYQKNLNSVLDGLSSQSASLSFSNGTAGTAPDQAYALFYCRYDLSSEECGACVKAAVKELTSNCTAEREGIAWFEQCTLHYANRNIFSLKEESPSSQYYSLTNVTMDTAQFYDKLSTALDGLINQAAYNSTNSFHYRTLVTPLSSTDTLYLLVQCTPDIDSTSCDRCLRSTVPYLPWKGMIWAMIFMPSCQMRYSLALFFPVSAPPPPPSSTASSSTKGAAFYILRAAMPAAVGILLLIGIIICFINRRRARKPIPLPQSQPSGQQGIATGGKYVRIGDHKSTRVDV
ncbi:hypothetical protein V2J09_000003 [Rumex salicifolius]